jgi:hypothetical protein
MVRFSFDTYSELQEERINVEVLTYHHIQDVTAMFLNTIMMQC